jgi:hypothetical protein
LPYRFSHVAVTIPRAQLEGSARSELLDFYGEVFGWTENPGLAIPSERIVFRAPSDEQYVTLRAAETPMRTSGQEHLGVLVDAEAELRAIHARAAAQVPRYPDAEVEPIQTKYEGVLLTFRVRFRLPLCIEVQHVRRKAS